MSNLGFEQALARDGIALARAKVGDRYVLEQLQAQALAARRREFGPHHLPRQAHDRRRDRRRARRAARADRAEARRWRRRPPAVTMFPQRLINVPVPRGYDWNANDAIARAERAAVAALGDAGRVLLRPSGTEPVLRVMVEARDAGLADTHAQSLADVDRQGGRHAAVGSAARCCTRAADHFSRVLPRIIRAW